MLGDSTLASVYAKKLKLEIAFQAHSLASSIRRQAIAQRYGLIHSLTEHQCGWRRKTAQRLPSLAHFHSPTTSFVLLPLGSPAALATAAALPSSSPTTGLHQCLLIDNLIIPLFTRSDFVLFCQLSHRSDKESGQLTARPLPVQTGRGPGISRGGSPAR